MTSQITSLWPKGTNSIYGASPSYVLSEFLLRSLVNAEVAHVNDVISEFNSGGAMPFSFPQFLRSMQSEDLSGSGLSTDQSPLFSHSLMYDDPETFTTPLFRSAGLFSVPSQNQIYPRMTQGQLGTQIALGVRELATIKSELRNII